METKEISPIEVIRAFYISNELLSRIFNLSEKRRAAKLNYLLREITGKANKLSDKKLLKYDLDNYHPRYDNYFNSKWEKKEIDLKDCGPWPRVGGLPDRATRGSVVDAADYIKQYLKDKSKLTLKTSRVLYIEEMMKYAEEISKHIPIIVLEDGVIRHMKLIKLSQREKYKKCKYDIDDGNHRVIALALLGKNKVNAYVGKRIYKSNLLY